MGMKKLLSVLLVGTLLLGCESEKKIGNQNTPEVVDPNASAGVDDKEVGDRPDLATSGADISSSLANDEFASL